MRFFQLIRIRAHPLHRSNMVEDITCDSCGIQGSEYTCQHEKCALKVYVCCKCYEKGYKVCLCSPDSRVPLECCRVCLLTRLATGVCEARHQTPGIGPIDTCTGCSKFPRTCGRDWGRHY